MVKLSLVVDVDVVGPTSDEKGARTIVKNEKESSPHTAHRLYRLPLGCGIAELWFGRTLVRGPPPLALRAARASAVAHAASAVRSSPMALAEVAPRPGVRRPGPAHQVRL